MSNSTGKSAIGRPFESGNKVNPGGRPKIPDSVKNIQALGREEVLRAISTILLLDLPTFERMLNNPNTVAQALVSSLVSKAMESGCPVRMQFLFNYILGKPEVFKPSDPGPNDPNHPSAAEVLKGVPSSILLDMVKGASAAAPFQAEGD